jgi:NAD(P)-dependent dehydrogenase (short-subunit alcohol dehydrogenase family)
LRAQRQPASTLAKRSLLERSTWIATGGARGVVAYVAAELGKRLRLKLHLLGSSPAPSIDPKWRGLSPEGLKQLKSQVMKQAQDQGAPALEAWTRVERAIEIDHTLQALAAQGIQAQYHACDVSDRRRVAEVVAAIHSRDGAIQGVIHGAGIENACKFPKKRPELVDRAIGAKVDGAANLMAALADQPPKHFVGFTSTSGCFGGLGQTDYSLSNAMLAQLVKAYGRENPDCAAVCIDWTAWDEIGMAARPESKFALKAMNVGFMPPLEGAEHLIDELQSVGGDAEILVVDYPGLYDAHPLMSEIDATEPAVENQLVPAGRAEPVARAEDSSSPRAYGGQSRAAIQRLMKHLADVSGLVDEPGDAIAAPRELKRLFEVDSVGELQEIAAGAEVTIGGLFALRQRVRPPQPSDTSDGIEVADEQAAQFSAPPAALAEQIKDYPLLESVRVVRPELELQLTSRVSPPTDIFLRHHQLHRRPFLPAVVSLEMLAEAGTQLRAGKSFVGFKNVDLCSGHSFVSEGEQSLLLSVALEGEIVSGSLAVELAEGRGNTLVTAQMLFADAPLLPEEFKFKMPAFGWTRFQYPDEGGILYHGPSLRTFRELCFQHDGGKGQLVGPPPLELKGQRPGSKWLVPSSIIDGCMVACGTYSYFMLEQRLEIPRQIGELRLFRAPREGEQCLLRFFLRKREQATTHYDFHLLGDDGQLILSALDFAMVCINGAAD